MERNNAIFMENLKKDMKFSEEQQYVLFKDLKNNEI
jgi:hypothetical protein